MKTRKIKPLEIITCAAAVVAIIAGIFAPKSGPYVMADEICDVLVLWIVCFYLIAAGIRTRHDRRKNNSTGKKGNIFLVLLIIICICFSSWLSRDILTDIASGPVSAVLTDTDVSKTQGHTGIFSLHYYLKGQSSSGENLRMEISGNDYSGLSSAHEVWVEFYENTRRVVQYKIIS